MEQLCTQRLLASEDYNNINEGITFGADSSDDDFSCKLLAGASLNVLSGSLNYRNVNSSSWEMTNNASIFKMYPLTKLYLYHNLDVGSGRILISETATLWKGTGVYLLGPTFLYKNS